MSAELTNSQRGISSETTGRDVVHSNSEIKSFRKIDSGNESLVYEVNILDEKGVEHLAVIKKFKDVLWLPSQKPKKHNDKYFVEQCHFTSQTADLFREEGLPVLPLVKSITTTKGIASLGLDAMEGFLDGQKIEPPFVVMTKIIGDTDEKGKQLSEFGKVGDDLRDSPEVLEGMIRDLAHMHKLGFVRGRYSAYAKHPIDSPWLFGKDKDGRLERWLVDITNLEKASKTDNPKLSKIDDLRELLSTIEQVMSTKDYKEDEEKLRKIYNSVYDEK